MDIESRLKIKIIWTVDAGVDYYWSDSERHCQ